MTMPVHVIGASGRSGLALCHALLARGTAVVPVVRNLQKWEEAALAIPARIADLRGVSGQDNPQLSDALRDASRIVSVAHARHVPSILKAAPVGASLVCLGSTRKFTRWPDAHGNGVLEGERALMSSGRAGVILHPTMIYGAQGENNVQRLAQWLRKLPVVPLPAGGRALVQPIHQSDVTRSILAALDHEWAAPSSIVIAGPQAVTYRGFVETIARHAGMKIRPIVSVPAGAMMMAAAICGIVPGLPDIGVGEIRRLLEDKNFDIQPMKTILGVDPITLDEGLAQVRFDS